MRHEEYTNTKFVYMEIVTSQRCTLQRQVLRNVLPMNHNGPAEVATTLDKRQGEVGEAIHLDKCIPVDCIRHKTKTCYDEL